MRTLKLTIEYDGTDFVGWQSQLNGRAVQDEIEKALRQITGEEIRIAGAGRTDAGVHARGQVASVRTDSALTMEKIRAALNGLLPRRYLYSHRRRGRTSLSMHGSMRFDGNTATLSASFRPPSSGALPGS